MQALRGCIMNCGSCLSGNQAEFTAEMIIHFSGLKYLNNPGVWAFPKVSVCLDCGVARFALQEAELCLLREPMTDELPALTNCLQSSYQSITHRISFDASGAHRIGSPHRRKSWPVEEHASTCRTWYVPTCLSLGRPPLSATACYMGCRGHRRTRV